MYGLLQAGIIAHELLKKRLAKHEYSQSKISPGFLHAQIMASNFFLLSSWWLWRQIRWKLACQPSHSSIRRILRPWQKLGKRQVCRNLTRLGLQQEWGPYLYAMLCRKGIAMFQTWARQKEWRSTSWSCTTKLWSETTVCNRRGFIRTTGKGSRDMGPEGCGHFPTWQKGGRWHHDMPAQCNCHGPSKSHPRHIEEGEKVFGLCSHSSICHPCLS